jgi:endonuclease/exonuclease/phosphatase family metal-dependent hydrolase
VPTLGRVLAVLLALLVLPACATSPPPADASTLRVMTWNVQSLAHEPSEWAEVIAQQRPDVLGVQEICSAEVLELAAVLRRDHGLAYEVVPGPIRPPTPEEANAAINAALGPACDTPADAVEFGVAVLALLPLTEPAVVTYPPDRRDEQRGYLTARVAGVRVLVTHVGLDGVQADQIRRLAEAAAGTDPVVVMGDLNVAPDAPELAPLRAGFAEIDPEGRPTSLRGKIDYIYLRGLTVASGPDAPLTTASDHRPLLADLRLG